MRRLSSLMIEEEAEGPVVGEWEKFPIRGRGVPVATVFSLRKWSRSSKNSNILSWCMAIPRSARAVRWRVLSWVGMGEGTRPIIPRTTLLMLEMDR